jgi:hypothetical protein
MGMADHLVAIRRGRLRRRAVARGLLAAGVGAVALPFVPRPARAQGGGRATEFT